MKTVSYRNTLERRVYATYTYIPAHDILLCNLPGVSGEQREPRAPTAVTNPDKNQHRPSHQPTETVKDVQTACNYKYSAVDDTCVVMYALC